MTRHKRVKSPALISANFVVDMNNEEVQKVRGEIFPFGSGEVSKTKRLFQVTFVSFSSQI